MQLSELVVLVPVWIDVERFKRKFVGVGGFATTLVLSGVMMFLTVHEKCDECGVNTI